MRKYRQRIEMTPRWLPTKIEKRSGVDSTFIFDMEGEVGFRKRERLNL